MQKEPTDQLFEEIAHLEVGYLLGMKVDLIKPLEHVPQDVFVFQALDLVREKEVLEEDIPFSSSAFIQSAAM